MEYPLMINGVKRGAVRVTQEGLYTVFEAEAEGMEEAPVRLAVYGGGEEGYLGVMQPWSGGMFLRRRISRTERAKIPLEIEYAAPAGETRGAVNAAEETAHKPEHTESQSTDLVHNSERESKIIPAAEAIAENGGKADGDGDAGTGKSDEGLLWFSRPDGTLTAFDGKGSIIALPTSVNAAAERAVIREINGKRYMLFRY